MMYTIAALAAIAVVDGLKIVPVPLFDNTPVELQSCSVQLAEPIVEPDFAGMPPDGATA